jgi:hypothetical protein
MDAKKCRKIIWKNGETNMRIPLASKVVMRLWMTTVTLDRVSPAGRVIETDRWW